MAQVNAGRVRFIGRGEYDNSTQYYTFDLVNYNGNSYFAKSNTMGNLPTNSTYWQLVAEKGNVGPAGPTGNGIDHISLTSQSGATKVYTIYYTDGTTSEYTVQDGEVTQEVFDEEIESANMIYNAMPKVSGEGTDLTLNNTAECPVYDIELSPSELEQETTLGTNLFEPFANGSITGTETSTTSIATIKQTFNYTRALTFNNGEITGYPKVGNGNYYIWDLTFSNLKPNTAYTMVCNYEYNNLTGNTGNLIIINQIVVAQSGDTSKDGKVRLLFTTDENGSYKMNYFLNTAQVCCDTDTTFRLYNIQLAEGNYTIETMPEYEPFTYGPSPNPQYPQEIHTVSGENTIKIKNSDNTQEQSLPLSLGDLEYCKIGDYEDEFYKATESDTGLTAGKWYLKKNIGKVVLDGSETGWGNAGISTDEKLYRFRNSLFDNIVLENTPYVSDKFIFRGYNSSLNVTEEGLHNTAQVPRLFLWIDKNRVSGTTANDIKNWLSNNNVLVYYVLATPTYTLLSDTLQTQLDNIQKAITYQEQTNISQTNNDLPFIIKMSAIRDLSGIFEEI